MIDGKRSVNIEGEKQRRHIRRKSLDLLARREHSRLDIKKPHVPLVNII